MANISSAVKQTTVSTFEWVPYTCKLKRSLISIAISIVAKECIGAFAEDETSKQQKCDLKRN